MLPSGYLKTDYGASSAQNVQLSLNVAQKQSALKNSLVLVFTLKPGIHIVVIVVIQSVIVADQVLKQSRASLTYFEAIFGFVVSGNRGVVHILEAFNSVHTYDGCFTNTLKKQFPKLTKGKSIDNSSPSSTPIVAGISKQPMARTISSTSSPDKLVNEDLANSSTSISSNDPSTSYDDEISPYCGPQIEITGRMSSSYSSLKQSKTTVSTGSILDDDVFFRRSVSKDSFHKIPFDFNSAYHGCDPVNLRKALEMPSTETTL